MADLLDKKDKDYEKNRATLWASFDSAVSEGFTVEPGVKVYGDDRYAGNVRKNSDRFKKDKGAEAANKCARDTAVRCMELAQDSKVITESIYRQASGEQEESQEKIGPSGIICG